MRIQYSREYLLSFAEKQECKRVPNDLDSALRRDTPSPDVVDGGGVGGKLVNRREQELPEWRRGPPANGGGLLPQRRKNFDEEAGLHTRGPHWDNRNNSRLGQQPKWDRERERGGREGSETDRQRWNGSEHDGLLGSGGGLRGPFPGGRGFNGGGRGTRNAESRLNKASGRDSTSIDGETFGEKAATENREEEERKRREDFEAMRREQQRLKGLKDKPKEDNENNKNDENKENDVADSVSDAASKVTVASMTRPSVPPGFSEKSKKEMSDQQAFPEKSHEGAVDPLANAGAISGGDLSEPAENPKMRGIDKFFSKTTISPTAAFPQEKADTKTSKFAHLFSVEDEVSLFNLSGKSPRSPKATMSETRRPSSEVGTMLPMPDGPLLEDVERTLDPQTEKGPAVPLSERVGKSILTCEDVEQSFLAEAKTDVSTKERIQSGSSWKQEVVPDNSASRHLLSILQKPSVRTDNERLVSVSAVEDQAFREQGKLGRGGGDKGIATLESLFGTSFMRELRSTDAPLSAKAVSDASTGLKVPPGVVEFQSKQPTLLPDGLDYNLHPWSPLWNSKPEKQRDHVPGHMLSLDEVEKGFLDADTLRLRQAENGDLAGPSMFDTAVELRGNRTQQEEIDSAVLSDFLKFKNHRKKANDSFLGLVDGEPPNEGSSGGMNASPTPGALFRSHSPPSINRTSPLHQLHQLLATKPGKQYPHNVVMGGERDFPGYPDGYVRRPPFPRQQPQPQQQQQQAMYEQQIHGHFVQPPQGFPPQLSSKQRSPSYFLPNGSSQPLHMVQVHGPAGVPPMSYGHPPPFGPGFGSPFAPPPDVFLPGGEHAAAASMDNNTNNNRWIGGRDHVGVPGLYQHGVNKPGFP